MRIGFAVFFETKQILTQVVGVYAAVKKIMKPYLY